MKRVAKRNSGGVRGGLIFLLTLIMASSASAWHVEGKVRCKGKNGAYIVGATVTAIDCGGTGLIDRRTPSNRRGHTYTDVTDENGYYFIDFPDTIGQEFKLKIELPDGSTFIRPGGNRPCLFLTEDDPGWILEYTIRLNCDPPECTGSIGDYVWLDGSTEDCDGIQDLQNEMGMDGVTVILEDENGIELDRTLTAQGGYYLFEGLCEGTYWVRVLTPTGYIPTEVMVVGSEYYNDSDSHAGTKIVLASDSYDESIDFGFCLEDCEECDGKVTSLVLDYAGDAGDDIVIEQKQKGNNPPIEVFTGRGDDFIDFVGADGNGTLGTEISIFVNGQLHTKIHTSCSKPIGPGLVSGDFTVVSGTSFRGGVLCPVDPDDDCGPCKGKVTRLVLQYNGTVAANITVEQKEATTDFDMVLPGQSIELMGEDKNGTLGTWITIEAAGNSIDIHTSCSQPIGPGVEFGDWVVVSGKSKNGGELCEGGDDGKPGGKKKGGKK